MAQYTATAPQTVEANQNILFTETPVSGPCSISHRSGSGLVTLRGITNQCRARFKVFFNGNIAIPTGGTVEAISVAISIDGEPINSSNMISTPAAVENYNNVAGEIFINVPANCCLTVAVKNTSTQPILVQNANLIVERVA